MLGADVDFAEGLDEVEDCVRGGRGHADHEPGAADFFEPRERLFVTVAVDARLSDRVVKVRKRHIEGDAAFFEVRCERFYA